MTKADLISKQFDSNRTHLWENPWSNQSFTISYDEIEDIALNDFEDETPAEDMDDDTFNKYCEIIVSQYMEGHE